MKTLVLFSMLFSSSLLADKGLFNRQEMEQLNRLKKSTEHLQQNSKDYDNQMVYDLYRTELLILSKTEAKRREGMTALKELDKIDQHYFFNKILDRKLRQKWHYQKKPQKK